MWAVISVPLCRLTHWTAQSLPCVRAQRLLRASPSLWRCDCPALWDSQFCWWKLLVLQIICRKAAVNGLLLKLTLSPEFLRTACCLCFLKRLECGNGIHTTLCLWATMLVVFSGVCGEGLWSRGQKYFTLRATVTLVTAAAEMWAIADK